MIPLALVVCALCASSYVSADPIKSVDDLDHVNFEGVVVDSNGNVIAEARVFVRRTGVDAERSTKTDREGRYRFTTLSPGDYELRAEAAGFQTARYENISAIAGATIRQDFKLSPPAVEAQITIDATANPTIVDTARTVVGGTVTKEQIDKLPTESRNPLDLIFTLPGVAPPALSVRDLAEGDVKDDFRSTPEEAGVFSLAGGAPFSNNITIEGLDNNDDRGARERINISTHAVEEVQVITNQFAAEYGRASGGRVNLRLRGGSNEFHGQAFYNFRDESLNANAYRRNADPARGFRIPFQNHNPGASAGGPLIKNRIFFFGAYEYDNIYDRAEITALTPVDANPAFPLPSPNGANLGATSRNSKGQITTVNGGAPVGLFDETVTTPRVAHTVQSRVDLRLGEKHDAFALFTLARNRDERSFPGGRRTLDTLLSSGRNSQSYAFSDNIILSSRTVNTARFQFSRLTPVFAPPADNPVVIIDIDDPRDVTGNANANPLTRSGNLLAGASTLAGVDRREERYQIQDTLNYARGAHTARIGVDAQIIRSRFVDLSDTTGTFDFDTVADFLANTPSRYRHRFNTDSELRNTYTGVFFQDDWKPKQNLTLSFGLRWENETVIEDRNNFGPRLSLAWDPFKTGKTVVRAGYGIFYNRALLRTLDDFILTSNALLIDTNNAAAERLLTELQFPSVLTADDPRVTELGVRESGFLRRIGPGFRIPESYQASLGLEREIARGFKVEVNYVFNRGLHLWREINANAPRLPAGFNNFTEYLLSRDFDNSINPATGERPISTAKNAPDVVRFDGSQTPSRTITEGGRGGRRVLIIGLNNPSTSNLSIGHTGTLAALRNLRPDQSVTQVEELQSRGNSYYHGVSFEAQRRLTQLGFLRASYTLSKLIDDGIVNTSSPLVVGDFRRERALSLQDARHRVVISGNYLFPAWLARLNLSGIFNYRSSAPFSIGVSGADRNLDDVNNDRPNFIGDLDRIAWRRPGEPLDPTLAAAFTLPTIGSSGNLPRNAGRGPAVYTFNLRLAREFAFGERSRAELQVEAFNPFNSTVFSFGSEFIDFGAAGLGDFLTPRRTVKPRTMRVGLKFNF